MVQKIIKLVFLSLLFTNMYADQQIEEQSKIIHQKWKQANELFNKAQNKEEYLEVAGYYNEIINTGIKNGYLYYNLGNTYLRAERIDCAILNYKRAQKYISGDENLLQNLHIAQMQLNKKITFNKTEKQDIVNYLFFWHFDWKYESRLLLFVVVYCCFWLFLFIKLVKPKLSLTNVIVISVFLMLALGSSISWNILFPSHPKGILLGDEIEVRKGNASTHGLLYEQKIYGGVEVEIIEIRDSWIKVTFPDDEEGWVKSNTVEKI